MVMSVPNTRKKYSAGQWVFVCVPVLGILHWHPFTISSSAQDTEMTLHFGAGGNWTTPVAAFALEGKPIKVRSSEYAQSRASNLLLTAPELNVRYL